MYNLKNPLFLDKFNVVLDIDSSGLYTPRMYKKDDNWYTILDGDILFDWVLYIKKAFQSTDVVTGDIVEGNLYTYQWGASIQMINTIMKGETKFFDIEWSRQSGKTFLLEHILGFMSIFGRRYKRVLKGNKWITITLSHKDDSARKNFIKIRSNIKKAVEIYNKIYGTPAHNLVYGNYKVGDEKKYAFDTEDRIKVDIVLGNFAQEWAEVYALTAKADQDGYSGAMITYVDEAILINAKHFMRSIVPFSTVNGGSIIVTGIASTDSSCLQFRVHEMEDSIKLIFTCDDIYRMMKVTSDIDAEVFKKSIEAQIKACGGVNSTEAQTNYYMSWEITDGKFTTREQLRKNNVLDGSIGDINYNADFIVAGLDLSIANDYTVLTILEAYKVTELVSRYGKPSFEESYEYKVKEIICYNKDKMRMDAEILARRVAKDLKKYKVDIVTCDNTGTQEAQNQLIYKYIKAFNINTLLIPFNFGGTQNKLNMMSYLESVMFSGKCKIPSEEYKNVHEEYTMLYEELIILRKIRIEGKQNVQYIAPKGKNDDFVMSLSLGVYTLQIISSMRNTNTAIRLGTKQYVAKYNKFKITETEIVNTNKTNKYMFVF